MGFLTILAPYIPQVIKIVNGAIRGKDKGSDKLNAVANVLDVIARSIDPANPNAKIPGDQITAAIQAVFDQMKMSGEIDGPKESNLTEKFYLIRASKVQEL